MQIHNLIQGSPEWRAHRDKFLNASDAPAMLGVSPYKTRTELLHERATGIIKEVSATTQGIFDDGHKYEALARPIAEEIIGQELYPVTGSEGKYGASFDGLTINEDEGFEHKSLNDELRAVMFEVDGTPCANLPLHHRIQMEQQLMVSGANRIFFMASKWDGDVLVDKRHCWYYPDLELRQKIIDGWAQFQKDLAAYIPTEIKEKPKAEAIEEFPMPSIIVHGEVTASNLSKITPVFDIYLANTKTELVTDQDFADGEANGKTCREAAKNLKITAKAVIDQIAPVSEVVRTLELYAGRFDAMGLLLEKAVKEQKESIKANAILKAKGEWSEHVASLESEIAPIRLNLVVPDFAKAVSGVKTMKSLHSNIADALADGKIYADSAARGVRAKIAWHREYAKDHQFLFADLQQIISKPEDDFQLLVKSRIDEHKKAEAAKIEAAVIEAEKQKSATTLSEVVHAAAPADLAEAIAPTVDKQAVVMEHQDEISAFMKSRNFGKDENKIRAVLVEFVKFQSTYSMKKAA